MSGTFTRVPRSAAGPSTTALRPFTATRAPSLWSSATWRKRFSKTASLTMLVPSAWVMRATNCDWRSVAKPGCGQVVTSTGSSGPGRDTRTWLDPSTTSQPAARSLPISQRTSLGRIRSTTTSPPVAAAATM